MMPWNNVYEKNGAFYDLRLDGVFKKIGINVPIITNLKEEKKILKYQSGLYLLNTPDTLIIFNKNNKDKVVELTYMIFKGNKYGDNEYRTFEYEKTFKIPLRFLK